MTRNIKKRTSSTSLTITGPGFYPVDIISRQDPGQPLLDTVPRLRAGGTCGNVLAACAALGARAHAVGRLDAEDPAATRLVDELGHWGVDTSQLHLQGAYPVPLVFQQDDVDAAGRPRHRFRARCPRCDQRLPGHRDITKKQAAAAAEQLPASDVCFLDRASPGALDMARAAAAQGALVVFEPFSAPSPRAQASVRNNFLEVLAASHVVKYSSERPTGFALAEEYPRAPLLELQTMGAHGLRYRRRGGPWVELLGPPAWAVVDAAGAGDWTTAVFLHLAARGGLAGFGALTDQRLEQALTVAQATAGWACGFTGARGGMYQTAAPLAGHLRAVLGEDHGLTLPAPPALTDVQTLDQVMLRHCPHCRAAQEAEEAWQPPRAAGGEPWRVVGRPGYVGQKVQRAGQKLDAEHGPGNWEIAYTWRGRVISRDEALELYTAAYVCFLQGNPDVLRWLVETARDVYDLAPVDVASGTDYAVQRPGAVHLQDIAVRIAVERLGERFQGEELIQIRSKSSRGARLSPGVVPFHEPDGIEQPEKTGWWRPGTVESLWQSNKVLRVRARDRAVLLFGGSFNPIHNGHLALARFALERCGVERVLFIPNGDNYNKPDLAPAALRLAMVQAATAGEPAFEVVDAEVVSSKKLRVVQTTKELRQRFPGHELVLLRSLDSLPRTHNKLFGVPGLRVLVLDREGAGLDFEQVLASRPHLLANRARVTYVAGEFSDPTSSTAVRRAVAAGQPVDPMVPQAVAEIIAREGLYRATP